MTVPNDTRWNGIHECVSRWNQIMPGALDVYKKHAAQVRKPASLLTEDEEEDDDGDDEPPPLMSGSESESESEDDDDIDSASSEDDTPVAPKKKSKAEISFAQRVQNIAISDDVWRAGRDLEAVLDAMWEISTSTWSFALPWLIPEPAAGAPMWGEPSQHWQSLRPNGRRPA